MPISGDFAGLEDLRRRIAAIGQGAVSRDVIKVCGEAAIKQLDDEFRTSTDPYGNPWAPLTSRVGKPLLDTGTHLRGSLTAHATMGGFEISTAFIGAAVHQYGATIKAKTSKGLFFRVRGAPTKRSPRGKLSPWIRAKQVTIPRRQYMPEGDLGPRWTRGINDAATQVILDAMGGDF